MSLTSKICRTAGCPQYGDWAIANKYKVGWDKVKAGDSVLFDFNHNGTSDHVGIVVEVGNGYVKTIEGNTGSVSQTDGDGVWNKTRKKSEGCVNYFVQPPLTDAERQALIMTAKSQVGYEEGRNNDNKYGQWYGANNQPYCMIFVYWCYAHTEVKKMENYTGTLPSLSKTVKIGQAKQDERGRTRGGKVGDQTGKEVSVDNYTYNKKRGKWNHWTFVARPKSETAAKQMAKEMIEICNSPKVGYNQKPSGGRSSLWKRLKAVGYNVAKIAKTDTSCTPLVCACIRSAGISIATGIDASKMKSAIKKTGKFTIYTDSSYTASSSKLMAGDVLCSGKHSAMVVSVSDGSLLKGVKNDNVILWQKFLKWYGCSPIAIDGDFGIRTEEFTKKFQYENGLTVDGIVGANTLTKAKEYKRG